MLKSSGEKWGTGNLVAVLILLAMVALSAPHSYGEEGKKTSWGFSVLGGINGRKKPDLNQFGLFPRLDISLYRSLAVELEGNFSYFPISGEKNLYLLGMNTNLLFSPIRWRKGSLFVLGGGGLAYTNSNGTIREIADSHLAGVAQAGAGFTYDIGRGWSLRGEYRFHHTSVPFKRDWGINTHNFMLGLSF